MNPGNTSTHRNVWCFVKYRHIRIFSVRLKRSTILAFVSSLCVTKWWIPCVSKSFLERSIDELPLSVCNAVGVVFSVSKRSNAAVSRRLYSLTERIMPVKKNRRLPSTGTLYRRCIFVRFATSTRRRLKRRRTGLCRV